MRSHGSRNLFVVDEIVDESLKLVIRDLAWRKELVHIGFIRLYLCTHACRCQDQYDRSKQ